ncbi:LysR family transcriptional regulator [Amaricoccus macauensis]|uniref:LysR family transcriptional regulator n=1 Tax=Amaricoccus macauensis TaxID=57001 RepID=UPI003C7E4F89
MEHWAELRTALMVARLGTVKAAAETLGVHRATVNRHVETLEGAFGAPLFQRHARGYTLTEAGRDLLEVAGRAEEMFVDLAGRRRGKAGQFSGALVITALSASAPLITPALAAFHRSYPEVELEFIATEQLARLEHGEAHVAIRAGKKPQDPDYVVQPFRRVQFGLFASQGYIDRYGHLVDGDIDEHWFVGSVGQPWGLPFAGWMEENVPASRLALRTTDPSVITSAVRNGMGIGFISDYEPDGSQGLLEVLPPREDWSAALWLVTHVDLHRTVKVQEFLRHLKGRAGG